MKRERVAVSLLKIKMFAHDYRFYFICYYGKIFYTNL